jgi:integrase/recombinase XerD
MMTQEGLSTKKSCFSTVFDTFDEIIPLSNPPADITLDAYLEALSYDQVWGPVEADQPVKRESSVLSDDSRRLELEKILKKLSTAQIDDKEYVERYLRHQYRSHFQPGTIRNTYIGLLHFLRFIKDRGKSCLEVGKADLEAFVEDEQDRGLKITTVKLRLVTVKAFLRFMIEEGVLGEDVFPWKLNLKVPETLPRAMKPEDVIKLLAAEVSVRDRAMILLLLRTGMRIGELLATRMADIHMEEQKILIYQGEKNQRGRVVYFSEDAKEALEAWMHQRDQRRELIFYNPKGNQLGYPAARMIFVKYLDQAGLSNKGYTLHCLRHTYATDLLNARMPLECLEKLLGHTSLAVTRRYAVLSDKTKEEEYFKAMEVIERRERDGYDPCDRELQALFEETQLFSQDSEELHEHP